MKKDPSILQKWMKENGREFKEVCSLLNISVSKLWRIRKKKIDPKQQLLSQLKHITKGKVWLASHLIDPD